MTVFYWPENLPPSVNEGDLALYFWDGGQWVVEGTSMVNPAAHAVSAMPSHASLWAVLAPRKVLLPLVAR
ncbi:MAG: hypothetical protein ISS56_12620 [Anaerolineae bacterium]|nr:hypothetical protein [Anaerolineae bacterium]